MEISYALNQTRHDSHGQELLHFLTKTWCICCWAFNSVIEMISFFKSNSFISAHCFGLHFSYSCRWNGMSLQVYIYIYIYISVCVCVWPEAGRNRAYKRAISSHNADYKFKQFANFICSWWFWIHLLIRRFYLKWSTCFRGVRSRCDS